MLPVTCRQQFVLPVRGRQQNIKGFWILLASSHTDTK